MIDQARAKLARDGLSRLVTFETMSFSEMTRLPRGAFDGAYSNFGGLNCAEDIQGVLEETARVLKPGSQFVVCILNRFCIWEIASFLLRGKFSVATRRLHRTAVNARIGTASIPTWYYTPGEFARMASADFALVRVCGLSIVSPPPGASSFIRRHPSITKSMLGVEERICDRFPFNALGDHAVLELVRKDS
jgi:SAM-dependent methyltransferase